MVDAGVHDPQNDAVLVGRAVAGESAALSEIFDRYAPRIHAYCTRMLGEPHTAADATQDTFVAAARRLDQLRDPAKLRPWLYAIARNECTRHGRARDRAVPTEDHAMSGLDDPTGDEPARAAEASEAGELLWEAAAGLDGRDRTLLELQVRHGLEGRELALAAGLPDGQISMATGRLRDRLERAVGALLVARHGRSDCAELQQVLADWDGAFSVLWRKRVARHIDACATCDQRRATLVAPLGSLAIVPAAAIVLDGLPVGLRDRTVDAMVDARSTGGEELEPWGSDGFPPTPDDAWYVDQASDDGAIVADATARAGRPPRTAADRRRRAAVALGAVAAGVLLVVGVGAVLAGDDGTPLASATTTAPIAADPSEPTADDEADDGASATDPRSGGTSAPELTDATEPGGAASGQATTVPGLADGPAPTTPPTTVAPPVTVAPASTTTPPPAPAPNAPPTVGPLTRSGTSTLQTTCNPDNATRTTSVSAFDDRGIDRVVLRWTHSALGAGERTMARQGASTWQATLGPFTEPGTVTFRAVAVDTDGASTSTPASTVTVEPCPG